MPPWGVFARPLPSAVHGVLDIPRPLVSGSSRTAVGAVIGVCFAVVALCLTEAGRSTGIERASMIVFAIIALVAGLHEAFA